VNDVDEMFSQTVFKIKDLIVSFMEYRLNAVYPKKRISDRV